MLKPVRHKSQGSDEKRSRERYQFAAVDLLKTGGEIVAVDHDVVQPAQTVLELDYFGSLPILYPNDPVALVQYPEHVI